MTEINRQPSGLSDFLLVRAGGLNPDDLSQTVRGVIDLEPFYWPDRMRAAVEPFDLTTGQVDFVEVPEGQVWKLLTAGFTMTTPGTGSADVGVDFEIERLPGQGLNGVPFASVNIDNMVGGFNLSRYFQLPVPLVVTGGQRITIRCLYENITGVNFVGDFQIIYVLIQD